MAERGDRGALLAPMRAIAADQAALRRRSRLALAAYYTYFANQEQRVSAVLASAAAIVATARAEDSQT